MKTVITYGTFDILHIGHIRLLERARALGDKLIVAVSNDAFNQEKGKRCIFTFQERFEIVRSLRFVDEVIEEASWEQKRRDILKYRVDTFAIGSDWEGKFDELRELCEVVYLPRTPSISTSALKLTLRAFSREQVQSLQAAVEVLATISRDLS